MSRGAVRIGTRSSRLALRQAEEVSGLLNREGLEAVLVEIETSGDRDSSTPLAQISDTAFFTKEIERALIEGEVDLAVHSHKDLATRLPPGTMIGAVLPREDPRDALITAAGGGLDSLSEGARVGTSSTRRAAFLRVARPDLMVRPVRGNVPTRLALVDRGEVDGLVLAVAGLVRLGLEGRIGERIDPIVIPPAPAQGAIAVQVRDQDLELQTLLARLDHLPSRAETRAERAFLARLGGGCQLPVGASARWDEGTLVLTGAVAGLDGSAVVRGEVSGGAADAESLGAELADRLLREGADTLLEEVRA